MRRFLARLILLPTGLIHLSICLLALWLDKQTIAHYLDGVIRMRQELYDIPPFIIINPQTCIKGSILRAGNGELIARLELNEDGHPHWTSRDIRIITNNGSLILRPQHINEPMHLTRGNHE